MIVGLGHVDLVCRDLERSLAFYAAVCGPLGLEQPFLVDGERGEQIHYLRFPARGLRLARVASGARGAGVRAVRTRPSPRRVRRWSRLAPTSTATCRPGRSLRRPAPVSLPVLPKFFLTQRVFGSRSRPPATLAFSPCPPMACPDPPLLATPGGVNSLEPRLASAAGARRGRTDVLHVPLLDVGAAIPWVFGAGPPPPARGKGRHRRRPHLHFGQRDGRLRDGHPGRPVDGSRCDDRGGDRPHAGGDAARRCRLAQLLDREEEGTTDRRGDHQTYAQTMVGAATGRRSRVLRTADRCQGHRTGRSLRQFAAHRQGLMRLTRPRGRSRPTPRPFLVPCPDPCWNPAARSTSCGLGGGGNALDAAVRPSRPRASPALRPIEPDPPRSRCMQGGRNPGARSPSGRRLHARVLGYALSFFGAAPAAGGYTSRRRHRARVVR